MMESVGELEPGAVEKPSHHLQVQDAVVRPAAILIVLAFGNVAPWKVVHPLILRSD